MSPHSARTASASMTSNGWKAFGADAHPASEAAKVPVMNKFRKLFIDIRRLLLCKWQRFKIISHEGNVSGLKRNV